MTKVSLFFFVTSVIPNHDDFPVHLREHLTVSQSDSAVETSTYVLAGRRDALRPCSAGGGCFVDHVTSHQAVKLVWLV